MGKEKGCHHGLEANRRSPDTPAQTGPCMGHSRHQFSSQGQQPKLDLPSVSLWAPGIGQHASPWDGKKP